MSERREILFRGKRVDAELKLLFDNEENVKEWKNYKLDRLEKRLNEKYSFETMSGVYDLSE